jgi:hypothetical protein
MCCDEQLIDQTTAMLDDIDADIRESWAAFAKVSKSGPLGGSQASVRPFSTVG